MGGAGLEGGIVGEQGQRRAWTKKADFAEYLSFLRGVGL